jgi:hypothetical protein
VVKGCGFVTESQATGAGTAALGGLLLVAARGGFGVSMADPVPPGKLYTAGKRFLAGDRFDTIHDDLYGLSTFEDVGRVGFAKMHPTEATLSGPLGSFAESWTKAIGDTRCCSLRTAISAELYASSRNANSSRARFLLVIMAFEALVVQPMRSEAELAVIDTLKGSIAASSLSEQQKTALVNGIGMLKRVSTGHTVRGYLAGAIAAGVVADGGAPAFYTECYSMRGGIVHRGAISDVADLTSRSNRLEATLREAIAGEIDGRLVR